MFQDGEYFGFKGQDIGDPLFLFHKMFSLGMLSYFVNFKKNSIESIKHKNNHICLARYTKGNILQ